MNPKYGVWMHLGVTYCLWVTDLDLLASVLECIPPLLFDKGIPNLVCGYILGQQCRMLFPGHCDLTLTSGLSSTKIVSWSMPILFEAGIPNLVCGYILRPRSVAYCFRVTVTLTSGFSSRNISPIFEVGIPNLVWDISCDAECHILFLGHCDLDL